jgi:serine/threonine protein phosphatase PrpC
MGPQEELVAPSIALSHDAPWYDPHGALVASGQTHVGRVRRTNEDSFDVLPHLGLFMVADGMGGAAAGEVASRMAIEHVRRAVEDAETTWPTDTSIKGPESGPRRFIAGIHHANRRIRALVEQDWRKKGMGTTFAGLLVLDRCAVIAHVGDSRVYRLREGKLEPMTTDHSLVNDLVRVGRLTPEEAATSTRRHVITRAVGPHEKVEVDVRIVDVRPGDTFLLCTDGLHGMLGHEELTAILTTAPDPASAVKRLITRANEEGGDDNVTAIVVRWEEPPAP